eukprot:g6711.t1
MLRIIAQLIRYCKGQIYMNKLKKATKTMELVINVWAKQNFQPTEACHKDPCAADTLYHLVGVLSSLGMTKQVLFLENEVEKFQLNKYNLRISTDYFTNYDRISFDRNLSPATITKIRKKAKLYFNMIFKSSGDKELMKWLVGPLTFPYARQLKRNEYKLAEIHISSTIRQYIINNIYRFNNINMHDQKNLKEITSRKLNLLKSNIDRIQLSMKTNDLDQCYYHLKKKFIKNYASKGRPVIIKDLEKVEFFLKAIKNDWSITNLKSKYGKTVFQIAASSDIANIQNLLTLNECNDNDQNSKSMNLSNYIDLMNAYNKHKNISDVDYNPPYLLRSLSNPNNLLKNYKVPKIFNDNNRWDKDEAEQKKMALFSVGPKYSYTSFHIHSSAFNYLVSGAKKWFLCPPAILCSGNSDANVIDWYKKIKKDELKFINIIEFTQLPGEVVYIPGGWSHAVINVDTISVGLAVELGWDVQYYKNYYT